MTHWIPEDRTNTRVMSQPTLTVRARHTSTPLLGLENRDTSSLENPHRTSSTLSSAASAQKKRFKKIMIPSKKTVPP
jgi:hypothetical protein